MDIDEVDTVGTTKKKNIEKAGQLVPATKAKGRKKHVKVKGPAFEIQEYAFDNIPEGTADKYNYNTELMDKYKGVGESSKETLKLYDEVRKVFSQYVSLVTIRDQD